MSLWHRHPGVRTGSDLTRGERAADAMRNGMGSWVFVFGFLATMGAWAVVNTLLIGKVLHGKAFDPYPYILLNLFLSMMAGLQGAVLLIAAKRQDQISSELALHDHQMLEAIGKVLDENTALTVQVQANTCDIDEVHRHVTAICEHLGIQAGKVDPT